MQVEASGDANLGILQGFFRDIRSRGTAALKAQVSGTLDKPVFSGSASISEGRLRYMPVPHALEAINGRITFDAGGVRIDDVSARLGEGRRALRRPNWPERLRTRRHHARPPAASRCGCAIPEGFVSVIDADLTLQGTLQALVLNGTVKVHNALWTRRIETTPDLFNLGGSGATAAVAPAAQTFPLRLNLDIDAPNALRIQNNIANLVASADLKLQGTYDQPRLFGHAEVERGDLVFEGNRYTITRGGIDFFNPSRIEPVFDIEAETRVRLPGTTYLVTVGFNGTTSRFSLPLNSDPPLPESDIISLLLGQTIDENPELRALRPDAARQTQEALLREAVVRLATNPVSAPVSRLIGEKIGIDTVIAPTLGHRERSAVAVGPADPRPADLESRLSHVRTRARHDAARADHRPRVRPERPRRLGRSLRPGIGPSLSTSGCATGSDAGRRDHFRSGRSRPSARGADSAESPRPATSAGRSSRSRC